MILTWDLEPQITIFFLTHLVVTVGYGWWTFTYIQKMIDALTVKKCSGPYNDTSDWDSWTSLCCGFFLFICYKQLGLFFMSVWYELSGSSGTVF